MSKVIEKIRVKYPTEEVTDAIRMVSLQTFSPLSENGNVFSIKPKTKRNLMSSGTPASVMLELSESQKVPNATIVKFTAANVGLGPLQVRECRLKLDLVKEALFTELERAELEKSKKESSTAPIKKDKPVKSELVKPKKLKNKHFRIKAD